MLCGENLNKSQHEGLSGATVSFLGGFFLSSCQSKENFLCLPVQPLLSHTKQENVTLSSFPIFRLRRRGRVRDSKVNKTGINLVLWSGDAIDAAP